MRAAAVVVVEVVAVVAVEEDQGEVVNLTDKVEPFRKLVSRPRLIVQLI